MDTNKKIHCQVVTPANWPVPPKEMSVSTQADIDECPRRWALSTAEYPEIWSGRGYPPKLQVAALAGSVVHSALEIITKQLARAGVPSLSDPGAPGVLKVLGGYTRVVEECVERILKRYVDNPRASAMLEYTRRTLRGQVPTFRARVQSMLSRLRLAKGAFTAPASTPSASEPFTRHALLNGLHSEVEIRAKSIGWKGKVDLLVLGDDECAMTEFKTGKVDEAHKLQIRAYAVMWGLDKELNPAGRIVDRLVLAYESRDVDVDPPSAAEIGKLGSELLARRQEAEVSLAAQPPLARPSTETCSHCGVRQLCDAYWASATHAVSKDGRFGDIELILTKRHGAKSWDAVIVRARNLPENTPALLRLQHADEFQAGTRVRVLDAAVTRDPEVDGTPAIVTVGLFSELYFETPGGSAGYPWT